MVQWLKGFEGFPHQRMRGRSFSMNFYEQIWRDIIKFSHRQDYIQDAYNIQKWKTNIKDKQIANRSCKLSVMGFLEYSEFQ